MSLIPELFNMDTPSDMEGIRVELGESKNVKTKILKMFLIYNNESILLVQIKGQFTLTLFLLLYKLFHSVIDQIISC